MPTADIKAFDGMKPLVEPVLLDAGSATLAKNAKLISGAIVPMLGTTALKSLTKTQPKTIFRYGNSSVETEYWLEFVNRTSVMRSPIADNQYGMLYWSDGTDVRYAPQELIVSGSSYPGASYKLGVPKPASAPSLSGSAASAASKSASLTVVYTYVTAYGEEGPPSDASPVVTLDPASSISVGSMSVAPDGAYNVTLKRIYVSSTVGSAAEFQFWKEIPVATTSTSGSYDQAALGEVIPSTDWVAPPSDLKGLRMMANGIAIGFKENTAYVSEPNLPHAWANQYPSDYRIVGVGAFSQSAVFVTDGFPYILTGVDPAAMTFQKLSIPQACVSEPSIAENGSAVMYASPDGIVMISDSGADVATKNIMSREQWQAYNPSSIVAAIYEGRYIATYQKVSGVRGMLIFDFSGQGALMSECDLNEATAVTAMHTDARTDTLYLAQGANIVRFDRGSAMSATWRSKIFRMPYPLNMGFGQVVSDAYPMTMKVYADGQLKATKTVPDNNLFRLPSGFRATDWQIELIGASKITQAMITTSTAEAKGT